MASGNVSFLHEARQQNAIACEKWQCLGSVMQYLNSMRCNVNHNRNNFSYFNIGTRHVHDGKFEGQSGCIRLKRVTVAMITRGAKLIDSGTGKNGI
jgi:hypothetical protein